jgi:dimethylhistidine N-methyltransferase
MAGLQLLPRPQNISGREFAAISEFARIELGAGLHQKPAKIAPKFFYNALGSKLFEAICLLDEYYLTRAEVSIYTAQAAAISTSVGQGGTLIDLGAGNCAKAALLFGAMQPRQYIPIDISTEFLHGAVSCLQPAYPQIEMLPLALDFAEALKLPAQVNTYRRLFFYPGSSIGNFTPLQAAQFLTHVRGECRTDGALLIGVDLIKSPAVLEAAYDDALGVTAAFNLNVLTHANELLGSDFLTSDWRHLAFFNTEQNRIEMHLEARRSVTIHWPDGEREFAEGERILTENSYKYTRRGFIELLHSCGFGDVQCWTDDANQFLVCHARAL